MEEINKVKKFGTEKNFRGGVIDKLKLMRPKHWIKNLLIFIPIVFSKRLLELETLGKTVGAFFAFSLLSSGIYILNDIRDVELDRQHEVKKNRPIASGRVSIQSAFVLHILVIIVAFISNIWLCGFDVKPLSLMIIYFVTNVGYSLGLKNIPFVDISLLVSGFMIRVFYGASIIGENVSEWVALTIISLSFYLSLGKRRNEIVKLDGTTTSRKVLKYYSYSFLDKFMYLCLSIAIVFYALWSADEGIIEKFHTNKLIWTVPLVILLMMKYSSDIESDSNGDPVEVITHDKVLMLLGIVYSIILLLLIYVPTI